MNLSMRKLETYIRKGKFYQSAVEDGSDIIFIVDFSGTILYHNTSVRETLGYRSKSLIGKNFLDYVNPVKLETFKQKFTSSQRRAYTEKVEVEFICKDKSYRFLEFNAINLKHKEGLNGFILDCRDITQRKKDAEELLRLQRAKEQFLANISHEIRTPINGIAGMVTLLTQDQSVEERMMYLNAIKHSAENLKVIINDILDLTAIESGKLKFERIGFNLADLLPALISTFTYQAREKQIELNYSIAPALNRILIGDPVRLNQILINLISNAVKFTNSGAIDVTCSLQKESRGTSWVKISVKDTGVGIPKEKLTTIFESFSQADESVTRRYGGTGLGLTIARQLVELQSGSIHVESKEHEGSTFTFVIPYKDGKTIKSNKAATSRTPLSIIKHENTRVLLVEDNDINRMYAQSILKAWNCKIDIAENGLVAVERIRNNDYDVVLMDVQMPVMDGYEATKSIRAMHAPTNATPIIALTANATKNDIEKCLSSGMNDYLAKPFTPEDLYQKIFHRNLVSHNKSTTNPETQFDLAYLHSVSGNNQDFVRDMVATFIQTVPESLSKMELALSKKDIDGIAKIAHQIKPSLALLGFSHLKEKATHLETVCKEKIQPDKIPSLTNNFIRLSLKAVDQLSYSLADNEL